ncbi:MAG: molybdopterin-guanine dinucleotide biosynthesis protein B [Candidatus Bipolaricaulota bacterium]|nr:molybdopterin-guanine dinucleotide biosynthesis protein B [Candidatus Bipolaricaulota bacterium]
MTPCIAVVGPSGSGKTTLMTGLIKVLTARGYRVGAIKHTHHDFEIDHPGKDSVALKAAGAVTVALVAPHKLALVSDLVQEPSLEELLSRYFNAVQLVLVEGLKHSALPKILLVEGASPFAVSNVLTSVPARRFGPEEIEQLADLLEKRFLR